MKARHAHRPERPVSFDPRQAESEDFVVEWEETDPDAEDMDARETAMRALGDRLVDD